MIDPDVLASMKALRKAAGQAPSLEEWRRTGRYGTPEEIAASEAIRKPHHCSGHSRRTGLACALPHLRGMTCCRCHGGATTHVRRARARRDLLERPPQYRDKQRMAEAMAMSAMDRRWYRAQLQPQHIQDDPVLQLMTEALEGTVRQKLDTVNKLA